MCPTKHMGNQNQNFKYLYGPVSSWRLGSSLGIDILSADKKICSFDCVYCQLGETLIKTKERKVYIPTEKIIEEIKDLPPDLRIDYITFSGMGEPTLAANLGEAIKEIRALKKDKIAVITNSSFMWNKAVRDELALSDFVMAKLDAADEETFKKINRPVEGIKFEDVYRGIKAFRKEHDVKLAIQIMFFEMNKEEFKKIAKLAFDANPDEIQINTPLRPCAVKPLPKEEIADIRKYFDEFGKEINSKTVVVSVYDAKHKKIEAISTEETLKRRGKTE